MYSFLYVHIQTHTYIIHIYIIYIYMCVYTCIYTYTHTCRLTDVYVHTCLVTCLLTPSGRATEPGTIFQYSEGNLQGQELEHRWSEIVQGALTGLCGLCGEEWGSLFYSVGNIQDAYTCISTCTWYYGVESTYSHTDVYHKCELGCFVLCTYVGMFADAWKAK